MFVNRDKVAREIDCRNIVFHSPRVISAVNGKPLSNAIRQNMALVIDATTTSILLLQMDMRNSFLVFDQKQICTYGILVYPANLEIVNSLNEL